MPTPPATPLTRYLHYAATEREARDLAARLQPLTQAIPPAVVEIQAPLPGGQDWTVSVTVEGVGMAPETLRAQCERLLRGE